MLLESSQPWGRLKIQGVSGSSGCEVSQEAGEGRDSCALGPPRGAEGAHLPCAGGGCSLILRHPASGVQSPPHRWKAIIGLILWLEEVPGNLDFSVSKARLLLRLFCGGGRCGPALWSSWSEVKLPDRVQAVQTRARGEAPNAIA